MLAGDIAHRSSESNFAWVMLIDIDHFKSINDTWGHLAGDAVLVAFAAMLKNVCRDEDVVARIGGEEFAVIFENGDTDAALKYAFRLLEQIRSLEITVQANETLRLTASLGIASGIKKPFPTCFQKQTSGSTKRKTTAVTGFVTSPREQKMRVNWRTALPLIRPACEKIHCELHWRGNNQHVSGYSL